MSGGEGRRPWWSAATYVEDDRLRLAVAGEIDLSTGPHLGEHLDQVIMQGQSAAIVVDLAAVTFLDSSGIAVLVRAHERAVGHGVRLTVCHCQPLVRRVFEVTGVWSLLTGAG